MRAFRMTTRRWMIAVAAAAILLGAEDMRRRRDHLRRRAGEEARTEEMYRRHLAFYRQKVQEGERLAGPRSWPADPMSTRALDPLRRLLDGRPEPEPYAVRNLAMFRSAVERFTSDVARHAALRRKYERASGRPWLPVEPDPPG
jgi:hypothetical protein